MSAPRAYVQLRRDDCARAANGTCMQVPPARIPHIDPSPGNREWWNEWLAEFRRLGWACHLFEDDGRGSDALRACVALNPWRLSVACVPSLNVPGRNHAVVLRDLRLWHDPSRRRKRQRLGRVLEHHVLVPA